MPGEQGAGHDPPRERWRRLSRRVRRRRVAPPEAAAGGAERRAAAGEGGTADESPRMDGTRGLGDGAGRAGGFPAGARARGGEPHDQDRHRGADDGRRRQDGPGVREGGPPCAGGAQGDGGRPQDRVPRGGRQVRPQGGGLGRQQAGQRRREGGDRSLQLELHDPRLGRLQRGVDRSHHAHLQQPEDHRARLQDALPDHHPGRPAGRLRRRLPEGRRQGQAGGDHPRQDDVRAGPRGGDPEGPGEAGDQARVLRGHHSGREGLHPRRDQAQGHEPRLHATSPATTRRAVSWSGSSATSASRARSSPATPTRTRSSSRPRARRPRA